MVFVALAVALAALFVRLGFWQLSRLDERRAFNATRAEPLARPEVPFDSVRDGVPYRKVRVVGVPDYDHEIALAGRSRNGSPGVHVYTPFRRAGSDTAVLVVRGWLYAADAATVDLAPYRERLEAVAGYTDTLAAGTSTPDPTRTRVVRRMTRGVVAALVPYPVHPVFVVAQDSAGAGAPARLPLPALGDGPHLGYAIQWFAFALTALGGAAIVIHRWRTGRTTGSTAARGDR